MTDGELVRQTLAGQPRAYEELVRRWAGRVAAVCHARVRQAEAAEDMAQEALLRAFQSLSTLADPEKFGAWIRGIADRACLDWLKARERTTVPFSSLGAGRDGDSFPCSHAERDGVAVDRREEIQQLLGQVAELPEECREVLMLYYYDDVTYRDLAQMLGVSAATINARLTKARMLLRERLSKKVSR